MAHRPTQSSAVARRVAWWALVAVLLLVIFVAWTAVPEPDLMAINQ
jgi:4-hydroxybenzoate polyprenyltransferase